MKKNKKPASWNDILNAIAKVKLPKALADEIKSKYSDLNKVQYRQSLPYIHAIMRSETYAKRTDTWGK